jgi:hypothetical protein
MTFEQHDYPNPKYKWCVVKLDGQEIGRCEMDSEGRLVPRGGRKAREPGEIGLLLVRNMLADARKRKSAALADETRALMLLRGLKVAAKRSKTPNAEVTGLSHDDR